MTIFRVPEKGFAVIALVIALLAIILFTLSWNPIAAGFLSDDAVYLLMADVLSPFHHLDPALAGYVLRQSLFPPVYPLMLALLGGGSSHLLWSHLITTSTLVVSLGIFCVWIRDETKSVFMSVALVAVYALLPGTLLHNLEILSEFPYLMFSLGALWLAARREQQPRGNGPIALLAGLAAGTRTAGLSLIVALTIWLWRRPGKRRWAWLLLAITPLVAWSFYKWSAIGPQHGPGYQKFWGDLLEEIRSQGVLAFVPSFLGTQLAATWGGLLSNFSLNPGLLAQTVVALVLVAAFPTWLRRIRQWRLDAWYLMIGAAMTVLYPFPSFSTRLVMPWIPLLLLYFGISLQRFALMLNDRRIAFAIRLSAPTVLLVAVLPSMMFITRRFAEPIEPALSQWKHTRYWYRRDDMANIRADVTFRQSLVEASGGVGAFVPQGECIYAVHTALVMLYSRHVVEQPPAPGGDIDASMHHCSFVLLMSAPGQIGSQAVDAYYPNDALAADAIELLHVWNKPDDAKHPTALMLRRKASQ